MNLSVVGLDASLCWKGQTVGDQAGNEPKHWANVKPIDLRRENNTDQTYTFYLLQDKWKAQRLITASIQFLDMSGEGGGLLSDISQVSSNEQSDVLM